MNVPEFLSSREIYPYGIKYSSSNVPKFLSSREIYPYIKIFQLMCPLCIEKSSDKGEISLQSATF